jgi:hypothetical protein
VVENHLARTRFLHIFAALLSKKQRLYETGKIFSHGNAGDGVIGCYGTENTD